MKADSSLELTPGPGSYNLYNSDEKYKSMTPQNTRGTSSMISQTKKSTLSLREGPGPTRYNPDVRVVKNNNPAFSISRQRRERYLIIALARKES